MSPLFDRLSYALYARVFEPSKRCAKARVDPRSVLDDEERLAGFAREIDAIGQRVRSRLGPEDVAYARRLDRFANRTVRLGRALLALGVDPITFWSGVLFLWLGRQVRVVEIGHSALHGAWDSFPELPALHSDRHWWDIGVDEECWRRGHNVEHHMYTNVAGRDVDMHIGPVRVTDETPHHPIQYLQLPAFLCLVFPTLGFWVGMHYSGLMDLYTRLRDFDVVERRDLRTIVGAHRKFLRKAIPYYFRNFVLAPALAGLSAPRAFLGAVIAEAVGNSYTAATLFCGHIGEDVTTFEAGTRAGSRPRWYAMQVIATNNFSVPAPISILCGALDYQIEHHLFPRFPPAPGGRARGPGGLRALRRRVQGRQLASNPLEGHPLRRPAQPEIDGGSARGASPGGPADGLTAFRF